MSQQTQQTGPAPDSPALVVTSNVQKYAIKKKKVLSAEESELFELTQAAGVTLDQEVFKIIVDLLKMNVAPQAVFQTLKAMCAGQRVAESCGESSAASVTSMTTAPAEVKAVRSRAGAGQSEKSRDAPSQKAQRQPSTTRGQKTKSSGSSSSSSQINST
ncbi:mitotic-spindle organizing protein 2 isoform X2 [Austrofundulus limnaeus]|uniref:Mitotic-spindle organizing protein 2 isoform X2 n=1 Tax=Austrofundulus limnaeus TaxID=52670 RepID=A0A2I4CHD4_AUSLI|nr:PREDICTED: mitotic-spindle organizing protein 2-like isoform X2 [Austrofundulus limnaeus]